MAPLISILYLTFAEINRASSVRMEMHLHYLSGDNNSPEARADIALNFNQALKISVFKDFCQDPSLKDNCRTENVKVTGADVQFTTSRGRREIFMYPVLGAGMVFLRLDIFIMGLL